MSRRPPPCAAKLASSSRVGGPPNKPTARRQREAVRGPAQVEIAGRGAAGRRQLDAGDRLPGDFGSSELREPGDDLRAPQVGDLEVDFEALEAIGADRHPIAVRCDRERLLALCGGGVRLRLKGAGQLRENERRQIVEIARAEAQVAGRQAVCADCQRAGEPRRSKAEPEIVDGPAAIVVFRHMHRALESMAVDIAGEGSVRVDEPGHVIGERFQGDAGCLAV